ncbi:hypothetical protein FRC04_010281 [Tulasnella sp. 424]|nr:hypothetical protein FRC04_010281 [Tulasnella sp. 424]KAG8972665.1 hypothetical protein FRC05_009676 [Tulasnella sp. 425]
MDATTHIFEQPLTEIPDIPAQFGQDGGKFYQYYDQLADELDEDLTKRLKSQLDSLLIFAGLFAGVNSAFLALTLPMMSADPADDTNALLLQLVKGGNATINSQADLPSATFSPPSAIYPVNVLFAVSLTCALMSSFLAVLGQQWLLYYRKRSGGGAEHQRNEQLRRQLGAQRWRLELVLDDILPSLLQVGLVIFCISFVLYLRTLSGSMSTVVAAVVGTALAITVGAAVCATWDRMCPYQSPLSHLLCWTVDRMRPLVVALVWGFIFLKTDVLRIGPQEPDTDLVISMNSHIQPPEDSKSKRRSWKSAQKITSRGLTRLSRKVETTKDLKVALLKRMILTSEQTTALAYAATNLCTIDDDESLLQLLNDAEFFDRLHDLLSIFRVAQRGSPTHLPTMCNFAVKASAAAIVHIVFSVGTIADLVPPRRRYQMIESFTPAKELPKEAIFNFCEIAINLMLEQHLLDGDLKHDSDLRLGLLGRLLYSSYIASIEHSSRALQDEARTLATCTTSHELLCTLALAVKMSKECDEWDFEGNPRGALLHRFFELARTTYQR